MTRSLAISFCIHGLVILALVLLGLRVGPEIKSGPNKKITMRPVRITPKTQAAKMVAGVVAGKPSAESAAEDVLPPARPKTEKTASAAPPPPQKQAQRKARPRPKAHPKKAFSLVGSGTTSYPTHRKTDEAEAPSADTALPVSSPTEIPLGDGPVDIDGEEATGDRMAKPYYHPKVTIPGRHGKEYIVVRFQVEASGVCDAEILEGTGDIHADARALVILRRWKWLPMIIDGEKLRSIEIIKLNRTR